MEAKTAEGKTTQPRQDREASRLWLLLGLGVLALGLWGMDLHHFGAWDALGGWSTRGPWAAQGPWDAEAARGAVWPVMAMLGAVVTVGALLAMVPVWGMARAAAKTAGATVCSFGCMTSLVWASLDTLADPNPRGVSWLFGIAALLGVLGLVSVWCDE